MKIYLLRHGEAARAVRPGPSGDGERRLTPAGIEQVRRMARHMNEQGVRPTRLLTSPLKRAVETADEVSRTLTHRLRPEVFEPLSNVISGEELCSLVLRDLPPEEEVLLVGHQPQLGEFAAALTGTIFSLPTAGLLALKASLEGGALLWHASPDALSE